MQVELRTPHCALFEGLAQSVKVPAIGGAVEVLARHAPLVCALHEGVIRVRDESGKNRFFKIMSGVLRTGENKVEIFVDEGAVLEEQGKAKHSST